MHNIGQSTFQNRTLRDVMSIHVNGSYLGISQYGRFHVANCAADIIDGLWNRRKLKCADEYTSMYLG